MNFYETSAKAKGFDKILDQQYTTTTTTVRVSSTTLTTYHLEEKNGRLTAGDPRKADFSAFAFFSIFP